MQNIFDFAKHSGAPTWRTSPVQLVLVIWNACELNEVLELMIFKILIMNIKLGERRHWM